MIQLLKKNLTSPSLWILLALCAVYVFTSPYTVQSGDTGELVTNSYFLRVPHPPGYPLWTLLYHLPVKYITYSTPFQVASLFTIVISLLGFGLLSFRFKNQESLSILSVLATTGVFWRYSILPDVFCLHMFFIILVFLIFMKPEIIKKPWIVFLVSLSVANHHTIVFIFPMYLYAVLQGDIKKNIKYSLIFGFLSAAIYLTLFGLHPEEYGSWGNIKTLKDLANHFFRTEYGTFQLHTNDAQNDKTWVYLFVSTLLLNCWSVLIALGFAFTKGWSLLRIHKTRFMIILFCLIIYLLTFYFNGVMSVDNYGEAIFERFLLQPLLLIVFMLFMAINLGGIKLPKWIILCFLVNAGLNVVNNFKANNYSQNTVIEDFVMNTFRVLPEKSIYYTTGDTIGFSAYYIHDVLKFRPDVILLHPNLSFPWSAKKAEWKYPDAFNFKGSQKLDGVNYEIYSAFHNVPPNQLPQYLQVTFQGLLFKLSRSTEIQPQKEFNCDVGQKYEWRYRPELEDFSHFEVSRVYDLEYGRCFFTQAVEMMEQKRYSESINYLEKALVLSPFSIQFQERLCHNYKMLNDPKQVVCESRLEELLAVSNPQYYLKK